ncbi:MAG: glycosyl transferase [Proteobacteria bacterium]|nr:MAG: glycosyl transferase [Pseudomonadota bacterium]PIE19948.1 MAG: glycosyl transferase [Pseudomonadota bacterium]
MDKRVRIVKRMMDIAASSVGLALTAPLFPFIAAAVYIDSPGPIFLRQRRAGALIDDEEEGGPGPADPMAMAGVKVPRFVEFEMYKFRSMIPDAEKFTGQVIASKDDPRITRVGKVLRKTRLDELPQLYNILRGDMSLVGPRPERAERQANLAMAIPFFEERMRGVKPGLTGLAQTSLGYSGRAADDSAIKAFEATLVNPFALEFAGVGGEGDASEGEDAIAEADDMRMKLLYDLPYVACLERLSSFLRMDISIILRTPLVMIRGLGR